MKSFASAFQEFLQKIFETPTFQARNQKFFRTGEVSRNLDTSINISSKTQEKEAPQGKIWNFFVLDILKTTF